MHTIRVAVIPHGSEAYKAAVELRYDVLRKPQGLHFTADQLESERDAIHYAAYSGDRLIGTAYLLRLGEGRAQLKQMAVAPDTRATGVGRVLLEYLEDDARARGFREIVADARVSALGFYLKHGYTASGDVYEHVGLPHRRISKQLIEAGRRDTGD